MKRMEAGSSKKKGLETDTSLQIKDINSWQDATYANNVIFYPLLSHALFLPFSVKQNNE